MKLICIIPARTNSKRLPNKNFRNFHGKPMIAWPLNEILQSEIFDKIVISTDKQIDFINKIKAQNGLKDVSVHIRRAQMNQYDKTVDDVCLDVLEKYNDYDYMMVAYPTSYALTWIDISKSFEQFIRMEKQSLASVNTLNVGEFGKDVDNGAIYWENVEGFMVNKKIYNENSREKYELPMIDINEMKDFVLAKLHAITLGGRFK